MSKQYCFKIINKTQIDFNPEKISHEEEITHEINSLNELMKIF